MLYIIQLIYVLVCLFLTPRSMPVDAGACWQGAKSITTFEILPEPPSTRAESNPWPTWPKILRVDYGHEEVKLRFGRDPRVFNIMSKVSQGRVLWL